jgi:hypothetical protein
MIGFFEKHLIYLKQILRAALPASPEALAGQAG